MKKLILVRGLPGSGKTTFAKFLLMNLENDVDVSMFAADDYFYDPKDGKYVFDASQLYNAHLSCQQNVEIAMMRGDDAYQDFLSGDRQHEPSCTVIVHNTFTAKKELKVYLDLADKYGFEVTSLIVENRHGNISVHNVPEETMERMKARFDVKL